MMPLKPTLWRAVFAAASLSAAPAAALAAAQAPADILASQPVEKTIVVDGVTVPYLAKAGETLLRDESGRPDATIFSTTYLKSGVEQAWLRPVTFIFNGGPGASSSPLHLGIGPIRRDPDGAYELAPNADSILNVTDLVFIDPVGTGYSRLLEGGEGADYWGPVADAAAVEDFINKWLAEHGRQDSPIFIIGESYGGFRLGHLLDQPELPQIEGALFISPMLAWGDTDNELGEDKRYQVRLPTLAAAAAYHGKADAAGRTPQQIFDEAAEFAAGEYAKALKAGDDLPDEERRRLAERMSALIGLDAGFIAENDLRIAYDVFWDELLKEEGLRVGRLDARATGPVSELENDQPPFNDPAMSTGRGGSGPLLDAYYAGEFSLQPGREYISLNLNVNSAWDWSAQTEPGPNANPDVLDEISNAMKRNPDMKLYMGAALYDLGVPKFQVEEQLEDAGIDQDRMTLAAYEAGHSIFESKAAREAFSADLRRFVAETAEDGVPPWVETAEDAALNTLFDAHRQQDIARSPGLKNSLGINEDQGEWTPASDARLKEDAALAAARLDALRKEIDRERLSTAGKLNYDLYWSDLQASLDWADFRLKTYAFTRMPFDPYAARPAYLLNRHRIDDVRDAEDYISRLRGLPVMLHDQTEATLDRWEKGVVIPAFNFEDIAERARDIASGAPCDDSGDDNALLSHFKNEVAALDIAEEKEAALIDEATTVLREDVCPAYLDFAGRFEKWGRRVVRNDGIWALPNGDALYREAIRLYTTLNLNPADIHQTGLDEVARIEGEVEEIMEAVGYSGTVSDFFSHLDEEPELRLQGEDAAEAYIAKVKTYIADMERRLPEYFSRLPEAEVVARPVEPYQSGDFYTPPPVDGSAPGIFYFTVESGAPIWTSKSLTYHEAIPGHHMQIALAQELEGIPEFRKSYNNTAYVEGWALYAEKLAKEMGAYEGDPYGDAGRLKNELRRAIRLVVDTGLHFKRWTMEEGAQYIQGHLGEDPETAMRYMERYANWPGQALGYKLGQLEFERLRAKAKEALGADFDIRQFHTVVLGQGILPMPVLETQVDEWIEKEQAAT